MEQQAIYPHRPEAATRFTRDGQVIGTVFNNWQGWIAAIWQPYPAQAITSLHATRDEAVAALTGASA